MKLSDIIFKKGMLEDTKSGFKISEINIGIDAKLKNSKPIIKKFPININSRNNF